MNRKPYSKLSRKGKYLYNKATEAHLLAASSGDIVTPIRRDIIQADNSNEERAVTFEEQQLQDNDGVENNSEDDDFYSDQGSDVDEYDDDENEEANNTADEDEHEEEEMEQEEENSVHDDIVEEEEETDIADETDDEIDERDDRNICRDNNGDGNEGDDRERENVNRPLYFGAPLTVAESMLLILTLLLKHSITGTCLVDIITVINLHCLNQGLKKTSLYKFKKYFSISKQKLIKHYYCSVCLTCLSSHNAECPLCLKRTAISYFIELPFVNQLGEMLKRDQFYERLQHRFHRQEARPNTRSDIYDGDLYRSYVANGFLSNPNNVSFTWNTDGVPVFKSSKVSMWPLYLTINELPYKYRIKKENTLLVGLWFGPKKPAANSFIYKFRSQFQTLLRGKDYELSDGTVITVRGMLLAGTCDLPAKAQFLNFMQFNGDCGCPNCKERGETYEHSTGGRSHVFRYTENPEMRSSAESIQSGMQALADGQPVDGVKGPCAFSKLMPDFVVGVGIDYMHCIFCGVVKRLLSLWFDSVFRDRPFSLSAVSDILNARLITIKPPKFVHRMPRTITELCHWKAFELKMWFFYYSLPILTGIMRPDYFAHYLLLVTSISMLDSDCVTDEQIQTAKRLLNRFVQEFETLYSLQFCTINIHQLLHLPVCVERLGPLWVYSCFPYEDLNGRLLKLVHGTSHIDSQIANAHCHLLRMQKKLENLPQGIIREFTLGIRQQVKICEQVIFNCYSIGTYKNPRNIPNFIIEAMRDSEFPLGNIHMYMRLLKGNKLYVSEMYTRSLKTSSLHASYLSNEQKKIGAVSCFIKVTNCNCVTKCLCNGQHYAILTEVVSDGKFEAHGHNRIKAELPYLHKCHRSDRIIAVPVTALESVCVYVCVGQQSYVGMPINVVELE